MKSKVKLPTSSVKSSSKEASRQEVTGAFLLGVDAIEFGYHAYRSRDN